MNQAAPAGWYPDPHDSTLQRYWDGNAWTTHTAPSAPIAQHAPVPPPSPSALAPPAPPVQPGRSSNSSKKWLIGAAIIAGVIVVGSIGAAVGSAGRGIDSAAEVKSSPTVSPTPTPMAEVKESTLPEPSPVTEAPAVELDPVAFRAQANSHLDDMNKDLDDIVVTVQESGFWRLFSNSVELSFNLGQLEALDVPAATSQTWSASLLQLDATLDALSDAISTQDGATILVAVDAVRAQVGLTRTVADSAQ